ncbi:FliM/FliN family flagellar motor switch protein [Sphingomonas sp. ERG5]|uniref:FliM/FliN family flagellar motor switch protein n=1 Tax=Sphingomonas sp. ERG5 TaxID=1381597 RepID=UPI00054C6779|nr:FliM/FliN family flagellar motor C-terminal domain-containing protein [Sphingomonas sp. ERG5]
MRDGYWMKAGHGLAIAVPAAAPTKLVARMLDASIPEHPSEADQRVVKDLARACLDDLGHRLTVAFRLPSDISWVIVDHADMPDIVTPREFGLGVEPQVPLLRIVAGEDLVIDMRKADMPTAPPGDRLLPMSMGLALQQLAISASLGRCSLTVSEMAGLSEGDVLVFDQVIEKPIALVLDGKAVLPGKCMIDHVDDSLRLKLLEPINR